jgi:pyruvate/2-oxoglutarate dehydrogenase complex dihydrolipoamide acyltransferase (E2) component
MTTHVTMPQLGESVVEGTIDRWLVAEGQPVKQYDPLLQVTTDKVDTEITAPAAGILLKIYVPEGQTVERGAVLAIIGQPGEVVPATPPAGAMPGHGVAQTAEADAVGADEFQRPGQPAEQMRPLVPADVPAVTPVAHKLALEHGVNLTAVTGSGPGGRITKEDVEGYLAGQREEGRIPASAEPQPTYRLAPGRALGFISPAVARLAIEHAVDLTRVQGTGESGRITKKDVQAYVQAVQAGPSTAVEPAGTVAQIPPWEQPGTGSLFKPTEEMAVADSPAVAQVPKTRPGSDGEVRPLSAMRRGIARHMVLSGQTSAHVTTVMEADMTRVVQVHERLRAGYEHQGVRLTFTPFFVQAIVAGLKKVPLANSSYLPAATPGAVDSLQFHRRINIGVAVAIADGLIVPVIRDADEKSLLGLARAVTDLAERARGRRLSPDEVQGGSFTLTNHGTSGSLFATPIINQPQAGILGVGAIQKRPVVLSQGSSLLPSADDYIAIRPMVYLSFSFDHRILDGAGADVFLSSVKDFLESYKE